MPPELVEQVASVLLALPRVVEEDAWVGVRWRISGRTIAHLFGGTDGLIRIVFCGDPDDVVAFSHLGPPYFRAGYGDDMIGMLLDQDTDWTEVAELVTISYCRMAPKKYATQVLADLTQRQDGPD